MKRARLTITLVSLTALALLAACGGTEAKPPLGTHVLRSPHTGKVVASFDRDSQSYTLVDGIDLTWLIRNMLEGRVLVEHQPEGLADKVDRPGEVERATLKPYVLDCRGGTTACNGECVDLHTDRDNCGTCGLTCEDSCIAGACNNRM